MDIFSLPQCVWMRIVFERWWSELFYMAVGWAGHAERRDDKGKIGM